MPALIMGGLALAQGVMGGMGAANQSAAQAAQAEYQEFQKKMQVQKKNREIAKQNALRWQNNNNIAKAANKSRAEAEYNLRRNYNNETGEFSRNMQATNSMLLGKLNSRNVRGQTAKQLMRQALESGINYQTNTAVSFKNQQRSIKRAQDQALSKRDFGYNSSIAYMPGALPQDQSKSIMTTALLQGALSGAMAYVGQDAQESYQDRSLELLETMAGP